jgi:DNA-binding transcriptional LysR family regulator
MKTERLIDHLEKLNTFKLVAELQSIHKASLRLRRTQPAVSRSIQTLESILECSLLKRVSHGVRLTEDGEKLFRFSQTLIGSVHEFGQLASVETQNQRILRIASYDNIVCGILSGICKKLISEVPNFSISAGGPNSKILGEVLSEKMDCGFLAEPKIISGLSYKKIYTERYGLFASKDFFKESHFSSKEKMRTQQLRQYQIIAMPEAIAGANKNIDRLLWDIGLKNPIVVDSYEVAMQLTRDGVGVGIMPFSTAWRDIQSKNLIEIELKDVPKKTFGPHDLVLCWNSNRTHPGVDALERLLNNFFERL